MGGFRRQKRDTRTLFRRESVKEQAFGFKCLLYYSTLEFKTYSLRLTGFPEAINSIFPQTEIQLCVVHQIRNPLKYVVSNDQKVFAKELKTVYQASTKEEAEAALDVNFTTMFPHISQTSFH